MAAHCAQHSSQERGRSQQLGNDNHERCIQDEEVPVSSINCNDRALFNLRNASNQHPYLNTRDQINTGIDLEFSVYIYYLCQSCQKESKRGK